MVFKPEDEQQIVSAIRAAEQRTSGEIRLYVEDFCMEDDPLERAIGLFHGLGMTKTKARNGVLLYLAVKSRHFAIYGDEGIHQKVGADFWESEKQMLRAYLRSDAMVEGLCLLIEQVGERLKANFPADVSDNENELPDEIVYG